MEREDLSNILPHDYPMILIDRVTDYSKENKWLESLVEINENSMFYDDTIKGVDSVVGIEYMAQTIGFYVRYVYNTEKPKIGFLLGTRLYNSAINKFDYGKKYFIRVKEIFAAEIFSFECFIYNEENEEIASATLNVYQSEDNNIEGFINV